MEEELSEFRFWDELIPEALGLIFSNLSLKELLTVIPCVCKSWRNAVIGPNCWQQIDIDEWSVLYSRRHLDQMLRMLIKRSSGSLRKLHVSFLNDTNFSFITENAGSLQVLRLQGSVISDSIVEQTAHRLSAITHLDLSYCVKIGSRALEAIGKHCKLLVTLCRNMVPSADIDGPIDAEANAIAATMPRLKHLEMANHLISTRGVLDILSGCPQLEFLEIRNCLNVKLGNDFLKEKYPKLKVLGPLDIDSDIIDWDQWSGFADSSECYDDYDNYCDIWGGYHGDDHDDY